MPMNLPASLQESVKHFTREARADATRRAYASDCRIFADWCKARGLEAFPTAPETVAAFVAHQAQSEASSIATIGRRLAAIARVHKVKGWPSPIDESVRDVLGGARRQAKQAAHPSMPLIVDDIRSIVERIEQHTLIGARDRALILVGFAGALRRSELRGLMVAHLEEVSGGLILTIPHSKTDQEAKGQTIALLRASNALLCPVSAVKVWLLRADIAGGAIFRAVDERHEQKIGTQALSDCAIGNIIKRRARLAGIDPRQVSAHSLRSGALTSGAMAGANTFKLRELSRHRSLSSLTRYIRPLSLFENHALKYIL